MKNEILSRSFQMAKRAVRHLPYPLFIPLILSSSLVVGVVQAERSVPPKAESAYCLNLR